MVADAPPVRLLWWIGVGLAAGMLLVFTASAAATYYDVPVLIAFLAATLGCAALPLVALRSWTATALQFTAVAIFAWAQPVDVKMWPLAVPVIVLLTTHIALVGLRRPWQEAVTVWWLSVLFCLLLAAVDVRGRDLSDARSTLVLYATNSLLVVFGSILWRQRGMVLSQLAAARLEVELEQAQRAAAEERTRIARELHDIVAHSMSVIHMQATSAAYRIEDVDAESRADFDRIADSTRTTLHELRQLLAVLRDESHDTPLQPTPNLHHLGKLAESARLGGISVDLDVSSLVEGRNLPEPVGLAAFRIVQESLSNVVRHASGAVTRVRVAATDLELTVEVVNGPPRRPPNLIEDPHRSRHGLIGMRERARIAGGTVDAGPTTDGGYRVFARLPLNCTTR